MLAAAFGLTGAPAKALGDAINKWLSGGGQGPAPWTSGYDVPSQDPSLGGGSPGNPVVPTDPGLPYDINPGDIVPMGPDLPTDPSQFINWQDFLP